MELEFAEGLIRNILGALRVISGSRYVSSDRSLRIFSSTSPLLSTELGYAYYCDVDETLVQGILIRPSVPIVFDFLKWLLGEETVSIGLLSSRGRDFMVRQLEDPKTLGTLIELGPLLDRDQLFEVPVMHAAEIGCLMYGGKSPTALEELMGWDEKRVDQFWARDFDKMVVALVELDALSNKIFGWDEVHVIQKISDSLRKLRLSGAESEAHIRKHPKLKKIVEKLATVSVDEADIRRVLAEYSYWFDTKETDPRTAADQVLENTLEGAHMVLGILRPENYDGTIGDIRRILIAKCPALKAWVRRHKRLLELIEALDQAKNRKREEMTKLVDDAEQILERAQYVDGMTIPPHSLHGELEFQAA